jgi:hypothetical protein
LGAKEEKVMFQENQKNDGKECLHENPYDAQILTRVVSKFHSEIHKKRFLHLFTVGVGKKIERLEIQRTVSRKGNGDFSRRETSQFSGSAPISLKGKPGIFLKKCLSGESGRRRNFPRHMAHAGAQKHSPDPKRR